MKTFLIYDGVGELPADVFTAPTRLDAMLRYEKVLGHLMDLDQTFRGLAAVRRFVEGQGDKVSYGGVLLQEVTIKEYK